MSETKGKGTNPKSHKNRRTVGGVAKEVNLLPEQWQYISTFGKGNLSEGLRSLVRIAMSANADDDRALFAKLPIAGKAARAIEMLMNGHPQAEEIAEAALYEIEELEIEQMLEEAIIDGDIKPRKGAWIV